MLSVREQLNDPKCRYQAQVWLKHHSHQCACFASLQAARLWAEDLHRRIVTSDVFKSLRRSG